MEAYKRRFRIILFFTITGLYWFSLYTYVPILSTYSISLGASYKMAGLIVGSYGFAQVLIRIPFGIISDRTGRRKLIITTGLLSSLAASVIFYFVKIPLGALGARFISGVGASSWVVFPVFFMSMFSGNDSAKSIGYISSIMKIGQVVAIYLGGLIAYNSGVKFTFVLAAAAAIVALFLNFFLKEKRKIQRKPLSIAALLNVAKTKSLIKYSLLAVIVQFMTFATVYGFTPVVAESLGATEKQLGLLTSLSTFPGIPAAALSGAFFAKRFSAKKTIALSFVLYSFALFFIPYAKSLNILFATQIIGGFAAGTIFPLLMSGSVNDVTEDKKASAMGFFQAIYGIGMLLGPYIVGVFSDNGLMKVGFLTTACLGLVGMLVVSKK